MHPWACTCRGPTPGAGWTPPDVRVGLEIFQNATYIISSEFCKNNFALKRIPGLLPIGVLPLGQGGRAPDVRVCLDIFQKAAHIISRKFCKKNSALKCIPALVLIGVLKSSMKTTPRLMTLVLVL